MPAFVQRLPLDLSALSVSPRPVRATQTRIALVLVNELGPELHLALKFAAAFCEEVIAVHVERDPSLTPRFMSRFACSGATTPLVVLEQSKDSSLDPLAAYIGTLELKDQDELMVVVPELDAQSRTGRRSVVDLDLADLNRDYCPITGRPRLPAAP